MVSAAGRVRHYILQVDRIRRDAKTVCVFLAQDCWTKLVLATVLTFHFSHCQAHGDHEQAAIATTS